MLKAFDENIDADTSNLKALDHKYTPSKLLTRYDGDPFRSSGLRFSEFQAKASHL